MGFGDWMWGVGDWGSFMVLFWVVKDGGVIYLERGGGRRRKKSSVLECWVVNVLGVFKLGCLESIWMRFWSFGERLGLKICIWSYWIYSSGS